MSWNITFTVDEHGKVEVDEDASYTNTAPRNCKIVANGHVVGEGEDGYETLSVALIANDGGGTLLQAGTGRTVKAKVEA
jgi:hypothetical protein